MVKLTPSVFYGKLNSYFYCRKAIEFFEFKVKKGTQTADDTEKNKDDVARLMEIEEELYKACVDVNK